MIFVFLGFLSTVSAETSMDLDSSVSIGGESMYYSVGSIPGSDHGLVVPKDNIGGDCNDLRFITWDGSEGEVEKSSIHASKGYVFLSSNECSMQITDEDYEHSQPNSLDTGWSIVSGTKFNQLDYLDSCDFRPSTEYAGQFQVYEINSTGNTNILNAPITDYSLDSDKATG